MTNLNEKFDSFLKEDTISALPTPGNAEIGLTSHESDKTLEEINSVLTGLSASPVVNPYYMVQRVKDRIRVALNLTFDDTYFVGDVGVLEKPLVSVDHMYAHTFAGETVHDNGFLNKFPGGLFVRFHFLKVGSLYNVNAEIIPAPKPAPTPVSEEK